MYRCCPPPDYTRYKYEDNVAGQPLAAMVIIGGGHDLFKMAMAIREVEEENVQS